MLSGYVRNVGYYMSVADPVQIIQYENTYGQLDIGHWRVRLCESYRIGMFHCLID